MQIDIEDIEDAEKAIKQAWIAGLISGGLTLAVAVIAIAAKSSFFNGLIDGWAIVDAAVLLALTYGVYRKSRASAVALLCFYLLNQLILRIGGGTTAGIGVAMLFIVFFVQGVRGTYAYHKFAAETSDTAMV